MNFVFCLMALLALWDCSTKVDADEYRTSVTNGTLHVYEMTEEVIKKFIDMHMDLREAVKENYEGGVAPQLYWNQDMADIVDESARGCIRDDTDDLFEEKYNKKDGTWPYGENTVARRRDNEVEPIELVKLAVDSWASYKDKVDEPDWYCSLSGTTQKKINWEKGNCDKYSAMIWENVTDIGCAMSRCKYDDPEPNDKEWHHNVWCIYYPLPNLSTQKCVYEIRHPLRRLWTECFKD